jgi:hypothetical protein
MLAGACSCRSLEFDVDGGPEYLHWRSVVLKALSPEPVEAEGCLAGTEWEVLALSKLAGDYSCGHLLHYVSE